MIYSRHKGDGTVMKKVSEWIKAGDLSTGKSLFSTIAGDRQKAFSVHCLKFNATGNQYKTLAWFPKSQCEQVTDDFYVDTKGNIGWLIPQWLMDSKIREGFEF